MEFNTYLQILRNYVCVDRKTVPEFVAGIFSLVINPPEGKDADNMYPYTKKSEESSAYKLFNNNTPILSDYIKPLDIYFSGASLYDEIEELPPATKTNLCEDLRKENIDCDENIVAKVVVELFRDFITRAKNKYTDIELVPDEVRDTEGKIIPSVPKSNVYIKDGILFFNGKKITLPPALIPPSSYNDNPQPYLNALIEIYKEIKAFKNKNSNNLDNLDDKYKKHLDSQRRAYYSAESIRHSLRSVFIDIDDEFDKLIDDAYEGIEMTYYKNSYKNGYERLQTVLEKITNTQLNKSNLKNIDGLITNLERKGLCHILVNEELIKSWVNPNE